MATAHPARVVCQCGHRLILPRQTTLSRRSFSTTPGRRRHGAVPTFNPSPSPELDAVLSTIRSKIFLPAHLKRPQQNLIYQTRHHAMLQSDPFEVEVGSDANSERFILEPINRTKDVPNSWKSVRRAMKLMSESENKATDFGLAKRKARDKGKVKGGRAQEGESEIQEAAAEDGGRRNEFDNLLPLLTGLRIAGRKWKGWQWEIVARTAGVNNAAYALLEAARQAEDTGLYLYDMRIVREVMWACRLYAVNDDWSVESCAKALGYVEEFARLMDEPMQKREEQRAIHKGDVDEKVSPLRQADVIGVVVELAAKRVEALVNDGAEDGDITAAKDSLRRYLQRLVPNIDEAVDESAKAVAKASPRGMVADYELLRWVPVLHGLRVAQSIGGNELPDLNEHIESISKRVQDARQTVIDNVGGDEGGKRRGILWCDAAHLV